MDWLPLASPQLPPLEAGEVHLVHLPLTRPPSPELQLMLGPQERERALRFAFARDRERYVLTRATLRRLLGSLLGEAPEALRFGEGPYGKPFLEAPQAPRSNGPPQAPRFNVSHSGEHALLAFALGRELGVDLEQALPGVDLEGVASVVFSQEEQRAFAALAQERRYAAFFQLWARKEAVIKAEGTGFAEPSNDFTLTVDPALPPRLLAHTTRPGALARWSLCDVHVPLPGYGAALAAEGPPPTLRCWRLPGA
jgi:4'-phosphopantetheinyl transferase